MSIIQNNNQYTIIKQDNSYSCSFYSIPNQGSSAFLTESPKLHNKQSPISQSSQFHSIQQCVASSVSAFSHNDEQNIQVRSSWGLSSDLNPSQSNQHEMQNDSQQNSHQVARLISEKQHKKDQIQYQSKNCCLQIQGNFSYPQSISSEDLITSECQYQDSQSASEQSQSQYAIQSEPQSDSQYQFYKKPKSIQKPLSHKPKPQKKLRQPKPTKKSHQSLPQQSTQSSTEIQNKSPKELNSFSKSKNPSKFSIKKLPKQKPIKKLKAQSQRRKPNSQHYTVFNSIENYFN